MEEIHRANVTVKTIQEYITIAHHIRMELHTVDPSMLELFQFIRNHCSPCNVWILTSIAQRFKLRESLKAIQIFERDNMYFRKKLQSSAFAEELRQEFSLIRHNLTIKNQIILTLPLETASRYYCDMTVAEFKMIIRDVFYDLSHYIHIIKVEPGSIKVTMYAPDNVMNVLVVMAKNRIKYLVSIGVTVLIIGEEVILNDDFEKERKVLT